MSLVLSLFPGIGLLDMAFEEEGFCVVRGPDLLWGGDVRRFHPPAGKFDGVIGGPPCQAFSRLVHIVKAKGQTPKPNLIPEFERIVGEAAPEWFVMENVPEAPAAEVEGYDTSVTLVRDCYVGGLTSRMRAFTFGRRGGSAPRLDMWINWSALHPIEAERAVVATSSKEGALAKSQQELRDGTSRRLRRKAFTAAGKYEVIGNGVPLPMGRAIARAVKRALTSTSAPASAERRAEPPPE